MKYKLFSFLTVLAFIAGVYQAAGQNVRFFRISGPAATTIASFNSDGTIVWSNEQLGTNYTVQSASSLTGESNWVDYVQLFSTNYVNTNVIVVFFPLAGMSFIPAGVFTMGNSIGDSFIQGASPKNIYVSAFYMDTNLVSYSKWQTVYNWATNHGYSFVNAGLGKATNHPVYSVDWYDSVKWCNARSQQEGLTPIYYLNAGFTQVYTNGEVDSVYPNWAADGYRLPTEAEWEKAARGGLSGLRFPWGDTISESQANYFGNTSASAYDLGPNGYNPAFTNNGTPYTSPVGYFPPNNYALYDMAGNLEVWCWDWYGTPYGLPTTTNPTGPTTGNDRVMRGGRWNGIANYGTCCAYRDDAATWSTVSAEVGFRCVRVLKFVQ